MKLHGTHKVPFLLLELLALVQRCNSRSGPSHTVAFFDRSLEPSDSLTEPIEELGREVDTNLRAVRSAARHFLGLPSLLESTPRRKHAVLENWHTPASTHRGYLQSLVAGNATLKKPKALKVNMGPLIWAWMSTVSVVFAVCWGVIIYGKIYPARKGVACRKTDKEVDKMEERRKNFKMANRERRLSTGSFQPEDLDSSIGSKGAVMRQTSGESPQNIPLKGAQETVDLADAIAAEVHSASNVSSPERRVHVQAALEETADVKFVPTTRPAIGKLQLPPSAEGLTSPVPSPRNERLTAPAVMMNAPPSPGRSAGLRSPRPNSTPNLTARTPRLDDFEEAVGRGDYFSIETAQLVDVMGLSGMALLEMDASAGVSGIKLLVALPCIALQAWFLQLVILFYMARRCCRLSGEGGLDGAPDEPPKDVPFVIIFTAIYLHFINCMNDVPFSFSILRHVGELHHLKKHVAVALPAFLVDGIVVPFTSLVVGAFYLCTSATVADVILNSCAVAFISNIDNWILSLNSKLNEASGGDPDSDSEDEEEVFDAEGNPEQKEQKEPKKPKAEGMKVFIPVNKKLVKLMVWWMCVVPVVPTVFSLFVAYAGLILLKL